MFYVRLRTESGAPVTGVFEEKASRWVLPGKPREGAIVAGEMEFARGWWNVFYSVRVRPTQDCVAEID